MTAFSRTLLLTIALVGGPAASSLAIEATSRGACVTLSSEVSQYDDESEEFRLSRFWAMRCCSRSDSDDSAASRSCFARIETQNCVNNVCQSNNQSVEASAIRAVDEDTYRVNMTDGSTVTMSRNNADPVASCQSNGREGLSDFAFGTCSERARGFFAHSDYVHDPSISLAPYETISVSRTRGRRLDYPWTAECYCYLPLFLVEPDGDGDGDDGDQ